MSGSPLREGWADRLTGHRMKHLIAGWTRTSVHGAGKHNANASEPGVWRVASHPDKRHLRRSSPGLLPGCGVGSLNGLTFSESGCKGG